MFHEMHFIQKLFIVSLDKEDRYILTEKENYTNEVLVYIVAKVLSLNGFTNDKLHCSLYLCFFIVPLVGNE